MSETDKKAAVHSDDGLKDEARREALKRFGRYAAAAPAAMVLLGPRGASAEKPSWAGGGKPSWAGGGKPSWAGGGDSPYSS